MPTSARMLIAATRSRPARLAAAALLLTCAVAAGAQVFVSPQGKDEADGTRSRPVRSIGRARDLARTQKSRQILLADGVYRLTEPVVLTAADSGLTIAAAPGAHPIVSGAVQVTGWKLADPHRGLWRAPAPAALLNSRQLYVNGIRAHRAKGRVPVSLTMTDTGYTAADDTLSHWRNPGDIEFVYTGGNSIWNERSEGLGSWTQPRCLIASIEGTTITMAQPCWDNSTKRIMLPNGARTANLVGPKSVGKQPSFIENAFELLGKPGEWYFDRPARTLYYVPRPGEDMTTANIEVPVLESLLQISGTNTQPAHNISIRGIEFAYATWLGPSTPEGFSEIQANYQVTGKNGWATQGLCHLVPNGTCPYGDWTKTPGNIRVSGARNIQFAGDTFTHLGAAGLDFATGTQNSTVEGCLFTDISGNGLQLGGVNAPLAPVAEFTADNRIDNNVFRNVGAEYRGGIAIVIGYARNTTVAHNELDHLPYAGISIGWGGWPDKIKQAGQANNSAGNVIANNRIHDFMLVLSDGGGIYTQGRTGRDLSDGERINGNVIFDQYSSGHGIYTDNGSAMITIQRNVVFHTDHDNINSKHHDYYDGQQGENFDPLDIEDNFWQQGDRDSDNKQVRVHGNHLIDRLTDAPADLLENAGPQPQFRAGLHVLEAAVPASAPEAPSRVGSFAKDSSAYVTWSPPVFDGGSPVTSYTVTASDGRTTSISASDFMQKAYTEFQGLTNGRSYTFTVAATHAHGASVPSLPSLPVRVRPLSIQPPEPPAAASVLIDHNLASVHFQSPASTLPRDEGAPIIAYAVTIQPTGRKVYITGRNVIALQDGKHVTFSTIQLQPGEGSRFSVAAVNAAGEGKPLTVEPTNIAEPH